MKHPLSRLTYLVRLNVTVLEARIDRAEEHMATITADGYPMGGDGGSGANTATEAAMLARQKVQRDHAELLAVLQRAVDLLHRSINICDRYPGVGLDKATEVARARCDGEMDPTCTDNAVAKGKCMNCYQRARRRAMASGA